MNCSTLPDGYRQIGGIDLLRDRRAALIVNIGALVIALLLVPLGLFWRPFFFPADSLFSLLLWLVLLFGAMLIYMVLHELVHGVLMRHYSGIKPHYGFNGFYAYAGSAAYFDRKTYLTIALAPVVLRGTLLLVLCIAAPPALFWSCYFIEIVNLSGAAGDLYVSWLLRKLPADLLVQDSGVAMKFFSASK